MFVAWLNRYILYLVRDILYLVFPIVFLFNLCGSFFTIVKLQMTKTIFMRIFYVQDSFLYTSSKFHYNFAEMSYPREISKGVFSQAMN